MGDAFFEDLLDSTNNNTDDTFTSLKVSKSIQNILLIDKITIPTEIQKRVIPMALKGCDILGCAETGSGKTLAFVIPLIQRLINSSQRRDKSKGIKALIILPTRELATQVHDCILKFSSFGFSSVLATGGSSDKAVESLLRSQPNIIVCTPGRLIDYLYNCPCFDLKSIETLVLDEADRLLDDNFVDQLKEIIRHCSNKRQTMLFSATLTSKVDSLACVALKNPIKIYLNDALKITSNLIEKYIKISTEDSIYREALAAVLCKKNEESILVFCDTKIQSQRFYIILKILGESATELRGDLSMEKRNAAIEAFRNGEARIMVSTDLASRGLDIPHVKLVINIAPPKTVEQYIHRVGRTARAGRSGNAITITSKEDYKYWKPIKKLSSAENIQVDKESIEECVCKIKSIQSKILQEINKAKELISISKAEREIQTAENKIKFSKEIMGRPPKQFMKKGNNKKYKNDFNKKNLADFTDKKIAGKSKKQPKVNIKSKNMKIDNEKYPKWMSKKKKR